MPFLSQADYDPQIRQDVHRVVDDADVSLMQLAEAEGIEEMTSYLGVRFDCAAIFATTGASRNPLIIMYLVDIVLYHIHARISPRNVPEIRQIRYERAIDWLRDVAKGVLNPNLPPLMVGSNPATAASDYRFGSKEKNQQGY
jgi:phage gp36-like protein